MLSAGVYDQWMHYRRMWCRKGWWLIFVRSPSFCRSCMLYFISSHLSLNCEGRWDTTDDFATSFLFFSLFSTALWDLANSRPVHSLMSSHLFLCLPCLLPPFTVPCKMVVARPDERETWPYHCSLRLFTIVRRSSCGPIACWMLCLRESETLQYFLTYVPYTYWRSGQQRSSSSQSCPRPVARW